MNVLTIETLNLAPAGFETQYRDVAEYIQEQGLAEISLELTEEGLCVSECWINGYISGLDVHDLILNFAHELPVLRANDKFYRDSEEPSEANPDEAYERFCDDRACMESYQMIHNMNL